MNRVFKFRVKNTIEGLKRQPESTTEDLEDAGDQENRGDADDDDMKALGAVTEEPVITIWINGETSDECESVERSYVDDVNGGLQDPENVWKSWLDTSRCRCIAVSQLLRLVPTK